MIFLLVRKLNPDGSISLPASVFPCSPIFFYGGRPPSPFLVKKTIMSFRGKMQGNPDSGSVCSYIFPGFKGSRVQGFGAKPCSGVLSHTIGALRRTTGCLTTVVALDEAIPAGTLHAVLFETPDIRERMDLKMNAWLFSVCVCVRMQESRPGTRSRMFFVSGRTGSGAMRAKSGIGIWGTH